MDTNRFEETLNKFNKDFPGANNNKKNAKIPLAVALSVIAIYLCICIFSVFAGLELSVLLSSMSSVPNEICLLAGAFLMSAIFRIFISILKLFRITISIKGSLMVDIFFWMYIVNIFVDKI